MTDIDPVFFEQYIIKKLFVDTEIRDKLVPYLDPKYFELDEDNATLVKKYMEFNETYGAFPKPNELALAVDSDRICAKFADILKIADLAYTKEFMLKQVEEFFKKKMLAQEISNLMTVIKTKQSDEASAIRDKITEILSFSFDTDIGLQTDENSEDRIFNAFRNEDSCIPTGIKAIDDLIDGFHDKSLTLLLAATNVGKTLAQCALTTNVLLQNKKVLYITFEESEDKLIRRILANMFGIGIKELTRTSRDAFKRLYGERVLNKIKNNLIIKEFPESTINSNRLRGLLLELKNKKGFIPDIVFVDYIGCLLPNRMGNDTNPNYLLKAVASEVRALSMEFGMPFVSALQANRSGFDKTDMSLTDTADSIGTTTKADVIFAMVSNEELKAANMYKLILLKNRYGENSKSCFVKVDYPKMRLSDVEDSDLVSVTPVNIKPGQSMKPNQERPPSTIAERFFKQDKKEKVAKEKPSLTNL